MRRPARPARRPVAPRPPRWSDDGGPWSRERPAQGNGVGSRLPRADHGRDGDQTEAVGQHELGALQHPAAPVIERPGARRAEAGGGRLDVEHDVATTGLERGLAGAGTRPTSTGRVELARSPRASRRSDRLGRRPVEAPTGRAEARTSTVGAAHRGPQDRRRRGTGAAPGGPWNGLNGLNPFPAMYGIMGAVQMHTLT